MRTQFRKLLSMVLMALGIAMFARGLDYVIRRGMGWQGVIQAVIVGALVFALGFTRWRYLRQR
jgi:hypothetical protein